MKYQYKTFLTGCFSYYITHPIKFFSDLFREVKAFFERGYNGFAKSDVWSFDYYLSIMIPKALRQLADHHMGYPGTKEIDTDEKWIQILNQMADDIEFYNIVEDRIVDIDNKKEWKKYQSDLKIAVIKRQKALKLLIHHFPSLWD
jgi:hypothetical protein